MHPPQIASLPGAIATLPGYYYLYALYFDYPVHQAWRSAREYAAAMEELARAIRPLQRYIAPYRKSFALRLFTERQALDSYPPEQVDEAWRQVREWIERMGPPPDWPTPRQKQRRRVLKPRAPEPDPPKPVQKAEDFFPRSPVDYDKSV